MKTIIKFAAPEQTDVIFEGTVHIELAPPGIIVILNESKEAIGMFPMAHVAGVYQPNGNNLVQPVQGIFLKK